jgi:hypothetical protein
LTAAPNPPYTSIKAIYNGTSLAEKRKSERMISMQERAIAAIVYDFDKTLSPANMQEYAFIPGIGMSSDEFWAKCSMAEKKHGMDSILAYMWIMTLEAQGKMLITRDVFKSQGQKVGLFPGVEDWFGRLNSYAESKCVVLEHYIISSGLKEIIEGTSIAGEFKKIFAAEFSYNQSNVPVWPAMAVNYTSKTQFLFRINKNELDVTQHDKLNEFVPDSERRIPFSNMVYIGDGPTDIPCMKLVKVNGGHSIAVYQGDKKGTADKMLRDGRVDFVLPADYRKGYPLERAAMLIMDKIAAHHQTLSMHKEHRKNAAID